MKIAVKLIFVFMVLFIPLKSFANNCSTLQPNSNLAITTQTSKVCVKFKNITHSKTYFFADPSFQKNAAYNLRIKTASGTNILEKKISARARTSINEKLNTNHNTEIEVSLIPTSLDVEYKFFLIHDKNIETGQTTIYIGLDSREDRKPQPPCESGCVIQSLPINFQPLSSKQGILLNNHISILSSNSSDGDAAQCTDSNRPPQAAPKHRDTGAPMNVNKVIRESIKWRENLNENPALNDKFGGIAKFTASAMRMVTMHRVGGSLDLAHAGNSTYVGSAEMGNFLYGFNGRALGFSESTILRGAAFYQAISDNGGWSAASLGQGIANFINNEGDNPGDPEESLRGVRHFDEVFSKNTSDSSSLSCEDKESIDNDSSGGNGGGSGGGGGGTGGGSIFPIFTGGGGGEEWCFVDASGVVQFCWFAPT